VEVGRVGLDPSLVCYSPTRVQSLLAALNGYTGTAVPVPVPIKERVSLPSVHLPVQLCSYAYIGIVTSGPRIFARLF
jgi:hypothetical protein